jgi:hypothetical protein
MRKARTRAPGCDFRGELRKEQWKGSIDNQAEYVGENRQPDLTSDRASRPLAVQRLTSDDAPGNHAAASSHRSGRVDELASSVRMVVRSLT